MAIISSYPVITPTSDDLVLITDTSATNNPTKTTTIANIAAFANTYNLGYTLYVAALTQSGVTAPVASVLQNNTGATFTWGYAGAGQYTLTASSAILQPNKVVMFISENNGNNSLGGTIVSTTVINIDQIDIGGGGGPVDGMLPGTSIEIRIYP